MTYCYCPECENGMGMPDAEEAIRGERDCPSCGHTIALTEEERIFKLIEVIDQLHDLENRVRDLELRTV